jgi:hypothetical protein
VSLQAKAATRCSVGQLLKAQTGGTCWCTLAGRRRISVSLTGRTAGRSRCGHEKCITLPKGFTVGNFHYRSSLDHVALQVQLHAVVPVDGTGASLRMEHQSFANNLRCAMLQTHGCFAWL